MCVKHDTMTITIPPPRVSDKDNLGIEDNLVGEDDMLRSPPGSMSDKDYLTIEDNLVGEDDMLRSPPGSMSKKSLVENVSEKPIIQKITTTPPPPAMCMIKKT